MLLVNNNQQNLVYLGWKNLYISFFKAFVNPLQCTCNHITAFVKYY